MKHIIKGEEPEILTRWKGGRQRRWHPTYRKLHGAVKRALKFALMRDQGAICCYCEQRLTNDSSHIEHMKPQCRRDVNPLDYGNLLCSCQKTLSHGEPRHCGALKGSWYDRRLFITPLDEDCEQRFVFRADGSMLPARRDDHAAATTIERLGLNIPKLRSLRRGALSVFLEGDLSPEEFGDFVLKYLSVGDDGSFNPFYTTVRFLFKDLARKTRDRHNRDAGETGREEDHDGDGGKDRRAARPSSFSQKL